MTHLRNLKLNLTRSLTLAALLGTTALTLAGTSPALAVTTVTDASENSEASSSSSTTSTAPAAESPRASSVTAPRAASVSAPTPPSAPHATGPTYNPPPPSGKDWGKLPQEAREQVLNDWKGLPEKDREPFIFYRERAMAKLPDSAYSDNPYKPEAPESAAAAGKSTTSGGVTTNKAASGSVMDKLFGSKDEEKAAE